MNKLDQALAMPAVVGTGQHKRFADSKKNIEHHQTLSRYVTHLHLTQNTKANEFNVFE